MTRVLPLLDKSHTISSVIGLGRSYSNEFGGGGKKVGMIQPNTSTMSLTKLCFDLHEVPMSKKKISRSFCRNTA